MQRHVSDEFVRDSKADGYRARSAYKLLQILQNHPTITTTLRAPRACIMDLGAAPGSWCQVLSQKSAPDATIIAIDLLPIVDIPKVCAIQCDFAQFSTHREAEALSKKSFSLVFSDLCANMSGNSCTDRWANFGLWTQAFEFASRHLTGNGHFVIKVFESPEAEQFRKGLKDHFAKVTAFKPKASRSASSEKYLVCTQFREKKPLINTSG